jgi:hypothetical protein
MKVNGQLHTPTSFSPQKSLYPFNRRLVGPTASLDIVAKRKSLSLLKLNPNCPAYTQSLSWVILAYNLISRGVPVKDGYEITATK